MNGPGPSKHGELHKHVPATLLYALSAEGNMLYHGKNKLHDRYESRGQHSFIYDFLVGANRSGAKTDLIVQGTDVFPLTDALKPVCTVYDFYDTPLSSLECSGVIVDEISEATFAAIPAHVPKICIIHNAFAAYAPAFIDQCDFFIAMTETSFQHQRKTIPESKLRLLNQGVDLERFLHVSDPDKKAPGIPRVLISARLEDGKTEIIDRMIHLLDHENCFDVTVLGSGDHFWKLSSKYGKNITFINHIPCYTLHNFLRTFDVVISSGRAVMEAMACGIPTLCAGFGYGGIVNESNVEMLLQKNLTGAGLGPDVRGFLEHINSSLQMDRNTCRKLAEQYFSIENFITGVLALANQVKPPKN